MLPDLLQAGSRLMVAGLCFYLVWQCGMLPLIRMALPGVIRPWRSTDAR